MPKDKLSDDDTIRRDERRRAYLAAKVVAARNISTLVSFFLFSVFFHTAFAGVWWPVRILISIFVSVLLGLLLWFIVLSRYFCDPLWYLDSEIRQEIG
jgi:hypothetical protein